MRPRIDPQQTAANPAISASVSANAGSGKTKTLVDRVARLLLAGARPETILCMTFTKAAASEMQRRLFQTLGRFAIAADDELVADLARLEGRATTDYDQPRLSSARRLFAMALETPGGLKIQTIHAFCEKLLRQFPLEAGVTPGFAVMDDPSADLVSRRARAMVAEQAADPDSPIGQAYSRIAIRFDYKGFDDLFAQLARMRDEVSDFVRRAGDVAGLETCLAESVGLEALTPPGDIEREGFCAPEMDVAAYFGAAAALALGSPKTDQVHGRVLQTAAEQARVGEVDPEPLWKLFFTDDGDGGPRSAHFPTRQVDPAIRPWIEQEQTRLIALRERIRAAHTAEETFDILLLGALYAAAYQDAKTGLGALDFADLIVRARQLLEDRPSAAWVLFKLDGGIDHILVDEAQDTSPDQWAIVRALTAEFFVGAGAREAMTQTRSPAPGLPRTVFIVGDEKQSIFSFQGAAPHLLEENSQHLQSVAQAAGQAFEGVRLEVSWRSTPEVLSFVDRIFEGSDRASKLAPRLGGGVDGEVVRHIAQRRDDPGTVDLWPLVIEDSREKSNAWDPLDANASTGAWRTLAERIAQECEAIVTRGDQVRGPAGWRPADYGDLLVLVRKRGNLFEETLRALKRRGVPVAGADQLKLSEHLVYQDLLSLARYALYPWDDLTLAEVLRSPLCDVSEDDLFDLAWNRRDSLSGALKERSRERPSWTRAADMLARARELARSVPPFEFFSRLLCLHDDQGRSLRQRFATRMGSEAAEALDAFLAQALLAEQRQVRDLERFCAELERLQVTIKREMDEPRGEVRVMTTHGAKGLEAPIVFMADTVMTDRSRAALVRTGDGGLLWLAAGGKRDGQIAARIREERARREEQEMARLLYVGLTRARDRLVLGGRLNAKTSVDKARGWLPWLADAFDTRLSGEVREIADDQGFTFRRFGQDPMSGKAAVRSDLVAPSSPDWLTQAARPDPDSLAYASPSTFADARRGPTPSPLAAAGGIGRFRRGDLIHKLFQILPDLPPGDRPGAAERILAKERDLTPEQRHEMAHAALTVLSDSRFAEVFGSGSRAEAAVAGTAPDLPAGLAISGRVDRMIVRPDRVLVIDFKTNRPAPDRIDNADPAYIAQMALYVAVLRTIFPGRRVEAALVWTDGPKLMPVPEDLMASRLAALRRAG